MDVGELEKPIQSIIKLVEKLDEKYRLKCFEILLNFYLRKEFKIEAEEVADEEELEVKEEEFLVPIDIRAFLQQHSIAEEKVQGLFLMEKNEVRPIYKITTTKRATAQLQIALLIALEHALRKQGNKFEFAIKTVRQKCKDLAVYDTANFSAIFKKSKDLFKDLDDPEHVELSAEGKTELAEVISQVAKK